MLRPAAYQRAGATSASYQGLLKSLRDRRGLLSGVLQSVGDFLGFGNDQVHPSDPKDTGTGGASSTGGNHEPTNVKPPVALPSPPAQAPPASYPAPGGGGQADKPTSAAPVSVSPGPQSSSATNEGGRAPHSTSPADAMNVAPTLSTAAPAHVSQHVSDIYGGTATSHTVSPGWPSVSHSVSAVLSPSQSPSPGAQIGHTERFPLAAAAAIGAVLGFVVVSALFWAVWLALRKRRRAYPEFASVHPKGMLSAASDPVLAPDPSGNGEALQDGNPFTHPRDEKEDDPFDAALCRASTARSLASTLSV